MPLFTQGQDPLDQSPIQPAGRMPTGQPEPAPFSEPGAAATVGAAFRQNNPVVSVLDAITQSRPDMTPVPGYDPVQRLSGTKDDDLIDQSLADVNPAQTDARIAKKAAEQQDQQTLAASGWAGTAASVAAGALDPSWFIPIYGELHAGAEAGLAMRAARGAVEGAAKSAVSETGLQASQVTRTPGESASAIATNTLLMGLIGGGMGMLGRGERAVAADGLDKTRADLSPPQPPAPESPDNILQSMSDKYGADTDMAAWTEGERQSYFDAIDRNARVRDTNGLTIERDHEQEAEIGEDGFRLYKILQNGEEIAHAHFSTDGLPDGEARLDWIGRRDQTEADDHAIAADANTMGPASLRNLLRQFVNDNPDITAVHALRISGARKVSETAAAPELTFDVKNGKLVLRREPSAESPPLVPDHETAPPVLTSDLSAAASDQRTMKLSRILLPENLSQTVSETPVIGAAYDWTAATMMRFSPTLRIFSSDSLAAKRAMGDLAETSLRFTQSEQGITTARGGVPIDRIVKMQANKGRMDTANILRDAFVEYRGMEGQTAPLIRSSVQDFRGQAPGKMSFDDFKTEVTLAASNGDAHQVPQVQAAAQKIRQQVLEPIKKMAQRTLGPDGKPMLGEELEAPKGDKSFFPRSWNKQAIAANYSTVKKTFADWLQGDQALKSAAKDRLQLFNDALQSHENTIAKIEMKLQGRTDKLEELTDRQEEIQRLNKFAYQRAEKLRESQYRNDGGIRVDVPGKNLKNAQGGAVFETKVRGRGNVLADQASGKAHEIDTLERQLVSETENAKAMRTKIEKEIADWEGNTTSEAKSALKARAEAEKLREQKMMEGTYEGKGERLTGADGAVDRAVKSILGSDRALDREALESRAAEIIHRINTAPDGRLTYESGGGGEPIPTDAQSVRGSLNARDFAIPTHLVKDFIHTDTEHVIAGHLRATIPDIHLTDRFGDIAMTDVFRRLNEEYDRKLSGLEGMKPLSERQSTKIDNERKAMVRDLAATRDRIRGVYGFDLAKSQPNAARIANAARNWNLIADLGTSVFNRLTDATNATWRHGLMNVFNDGYRPFLTGMLSAESGGKAAKQSMQDMGVGIDSHLGHMSHQWGDVIENYLPGSKFERALSWAADKSMMVNLHGPWTDGIKTVAGTVAAADFLRMAERVAGGSGTAQDTQRLAQAGIAPHMAERIWQAYSDGGGQEFGKGTHVANTADWKDTHARDVFTAAIGRDADLAVLTPGLERPLWMSGPVVSLLGQYKSFVSAAHEKILISNLQQADGRTLQGLVAAIGMGMLSYRAYTLWSGGPTSDRPQDWIKEGISRSAIGGWYTELNSIQAKFTGGNTDAFRAIGADHPLSRRQSNSALSELLGPTYSRLEGLATGLNDASHGTWTAMDTHKYRQAMWLQNLFATRRLLDMAEDGFNEQIGVKPLNRDPAAWPVH